MFIFREKEKYRSLSAEFSSAEIFVYTREIVALRPLRSVRFRFRTWTPFRPRIFPSASFPRLRIFPAGHKLKPWENCVNEKRHLTA